MAGITNITILPAVITPQFNTSVHQYTGILSQPSFNISYTIEATSINPITVEIDYLGNHYEQTHALDGSNTIPFTATEDGENTLTVQIYPYTTPQQTITYTYTLTYTIGNVKYPILQHYLDPGFYGGTYIANYRRLWDIYSVGNDPNWYADADYTIKSDKTLQAIAEATQIIDLATNQGKADAIVELFTHYSGFVNSNWPDSGTATESYDYRFFLPIIRVGVNRPSTLQGGYVPKNNKLFCYPYASMELQGYGQNQELKYEDFDSKTTSLKYLGIVSKFVAGATIMLYPFDYNGVEDNFDYGVCGNELQVFPYTIDKYLNDYHAARNTRTQNMAALIQSAGFQAATSWLGGAAAGGSNIRREVTPATQGNEVPVYHGNPVDFRGSGHMGFTNSDRTAPIYQNAFTGGSGVYEGGTPGKIDWTGAAISGGAQALANSIRAVGGGILSIHQGYAAMAAELADVQNRPPVLSNQNAAPSIPIAIKEGACPYVVYKSIRKEIAQRIDTFFSRFGYRTNRMGTPNIYKRPYFSFLKCHNAILGGNIPAEDKEALKIIFQKGVTFWHTSQPGFTSVGDYNSLTNINLAAIR